MIMKTTKSLMNSTTTLTPEITTLFPQQSTQFLTDEVTTALTNGSDFEITHHNASISGNITLKNFSIIAGGKVFPTEIYDNTTSPFKETSVGLLATRASFLAIFIFLGFSGNFILVATVTHSRRLQSSVLNLLIANLAIVNLIDTVVNLPLVLGCTITQNWEYGEFACQFNSFMINLVNVLTLFCILTMCFDRLFAVIELSKYKKRITRTRIILLLLLSWVISIVMMIPIIVGAIPSKAFHYRYLCSVAETASIVYIVAQTMLGVIAPIFIIVGLLIKILHVIHKKCHLGDIQNQHSYSNSWSDDPDMWENEVGGARFVGVLFLFWVVLEGPYVTLNYIEQYSNSAEVNTPVYVKFTYTREIDLAFTWMRLSFSVVLPLLAFIARKELKFKIKDLVLCRKSNLIVDASPLRMCTQKSFERSSDGGGSLNVSQATSFKVPVLFATADGLHLQTFTENELSDTDSDSYHEGDLNNSEVLNDTRNFRSRKCDVNASRDNFNDDTSDYDSELEPDFALQSSQPISVRQLNKLSGEYVAELSLKTPEISPDNDADKKIDAEIEQESVIRLDSGIDSVPNTHEKKKKRKKKKSSSEVEVTKIEAFKLEDNEKIRKKKDSWYYQNGSSVVETRINVNNNTSNQKSAPSFINCETTAVEVNESKEAVEIPKKKKRKRESNRRRASDIHLNNETLENGTCPSSHIDGIVLRPPPRLKPLNHKNSFSYKKDDSSECNSVMAKSKYEQTNATSKDTFCAVEESSNLNHSINSQYNSKNSDESQKSLLHSKKKSSTNGHAKDKPRRSTRHRKVDSVDLQLCSSNDSTAVIKVDSDILTSRVNTADISRKNGDIELGEMVHHVSSNKSKKKSKHTNDGIMRDNIVKS